MVRIIEHDVIDDNDDANRQPPPAAPAEADDVAGEEDGKGSKKEKTQSTTTTTRSGEDDGTGESMGESSTGMNGGGESSNEAEEHKARGNTCFAEGRWAEAERHYTLALETCIAAAPPLSDPTTNTTTTTTTTVSTSTSTSTTTAVLPNGGGGIKDRPRAVYHANRAACYMVMERYKEAVEDCTDAIAADNGYTKAYLRRGAAREKLGDLEGALADNEKVANELEPGHAQAAAAVAKLRPVVERKREEMKEEMMLKLKDLGNSILGNFGLSTDNFKAEKDDATGSYNIQFVQNP